MGYTFFMDSGCSAQANKSVLMNSYISGLAFLAGHRNNHGHENLYRNIHETVIDFHDISSCGDDKIATIKVH